MLSEQTTYIQELAPAEIESQSTWYRVEVNILAYISRQSYGTILIFLASIQGRAQTELGDT